MLAEANLCVGDEEILMVLPINFVQLMLQIFAVLLEKCVENTT